MFRQQMALTEKLDSSSVSGNFLDQTDGIFLNFSDTDPIGTSEIMDQDSGEIDDQVYNPIDMNSTDFNPDIYMNKILKESRLSELMDTEQMLYKQIQTLDSEMQTLIYENYNKFISATETVKKMTSHFDKMEHELDLLSKNMDSITNKSNEIASNLSGKREQLTQMSIKNNLLNKIQFILELPGKMKLLIGQNNYNEAVDNYLNVRHSLNKYCHLSSFKNIQKECNQMLEEIKRHFYRQLSDENSTTLQINESIGYLAKLNECPSNLCEKYFEMCEKKMAVSLNEIKTQTELNGPNKPDLLEFIDTVCNNYLGSLNECIQFYNDCFMAQKDSGSSQNELLYREIEEKLKNFVDKRMEDLFEIILNHIKREQKAPNNIIMLVRALDRFYKRIQLLNQVVGFSDFSEKSLAIIYESTKDQCDQLLSNLLAKHQEELANIRHDVINDIGRTTKNASPKDGSKNTLSEMVIAFETSICENLKSVLSELNPFLHHELSFMNKNFKDKFIKNCIFETIIIKYIQFILDRFEEYESDYTTSHIPSCFILILSKICVDLSDSIITYLFQFTEKIFGTSRFEEKLSPPLVKRARLDGQKLLNAYVWIEGESISHMIRKSVETRDWLSTVEPRSVRSVMKRVIEDITLIDFLVGQLYEEGTRVERSSDSSKTYSTFSYNKSRYNKSNWSYGSSSFDNNIISNIQKLFNDKIEIFGKVEFSRLSVDTGIVKIGLKTLIECVRLCSFSRYGFQQIQVDSFYLQTRLWRFASDEKIIMNLIDEVITSSKKRCLDPVGMDRSVIENICDNR